MIQKCFKTYVLSCDICGSPDVEEQFDTFQDAVDYKKNAMWETQRRNGEWEDICPECDAND